MAQSTRNIETLIADGGDINIGALPPHECAATAADGRNCLAMLVRRDGETFNALLKRLDRAIGMAWSDDLFIDEVNDGERSAVVATRFDRQEGLGRSLTIAVQSVGDDLAGELAGETLILPDLRLSPRLHQWYRSFLDCGNTRTLNYIEVTQIQAGLGLCAAGEGICVLPEHLGRLLADDVCYARLISAPRSELSAVWRNDSPTRHVAQFLAAWR